MAKTPIPHEPLPKKAKDVGPVGPIVDPAADDQGVTVTNPVPRVIDWKDSSTIKYIALAFVGSILLQLQPMLMSHAIDWWSLGSQAVASLGAIIIRMLQSDVKAPFAFMNTNNLDKK